ncbi:Plant basic secretory protein (BSP) family protein [Thalictrum thalictroides]|uniref:Plant basic secretory protein (BSP) family protein n=1 Tax=Thalictrum thalictroides TaxID=46969 RepID=A0A7J6WHK2_THATH|nr:Plant basic secretory protein (BSP) family protein [Thalictrum thalictroides]
MDVEEHHNLLQSFITTTTTSKSTTYFSDNTAVLYSNSHIALRFILIFFIIIISIFANYQASKGFEIIIINDVKHTHPLGSKFHLFFVSNDKATQIVLNTSNLAEHVLYPDNQQPKKPVIRVTVRFTNENLTSQVVVKAAKIEQDISYEYVLHISSSLMEESNAERAMVLAVQRAMVRVWLWNNRENYAPDELIDGIVEYVMVIAGFVPSPPDCSKLSQLPVSSTDYSHSMCWKNWDHAIDMVQFLIYCEMMRNGFIGRLNQAMQVSWHDHMVDDALGLPVGHLCESYYYSSSTLQSSL